MNRAPAIIVSQGYKPDERARTSLGAAMHIIGALVGLALIYAMLALIGYGWVEIITRFA